MHGSEGDEKRHIDNNSCRVVLTCLPYKRSVAGSIPAGRVKCKLSLWWDSELEFAIPP